MAKKQETKPIRLQLALQGGGAKLSVLLAAMEAVQDLTNKGTIEVTRIAGTSAGSIAACLFAAGIDLKTVRQKFKVIGANGSLKRFKVGASNLPKLGFGWPIWGMDFLQGELAALFDEVKVRTMGDLRKKKNITPFVIATSLSELRSVTYDGSAGKDEDKNLVHALMDSCALPYFFRVWSSGNPVIVDGGICDNLPSTDLEEGVAEFGQVVGISFDDKSPKTPDSFGSFTLALLNTAMNHSIKRAKKRLDGRIFSIKTDIDTFDFKKGFTQGLDKDYDLVKREAAEWFNEYIQRLNSSAPKTAPQTIWDFESSEIMSRLWRIYVAQSQDRPLKYLAQTLEVQAGTLTDEDDVDYVWYNLTFQTLADPLYCMGFTLSSNALISEADFSRLKTVFHVTKAGTEEKVAVEFVPTVIPAESPDGDTQKAVLLFFMPPLPAKSGPYTLRCEDTVKGFVGGLRDGAADYMQVTSSRAAGTIDRIDLILFVPEDFPHGIDMVQKQASGGSMAKSQIPERPGFRRMGWRAENVSPDKPFRVELIKNTVHKP